jgi:MarR family transcriptional regulator, organic hydroperoxide resistance regulator
LAFSVKYVSAYIMSNERTLSDFPASRGSAALGARLRRLSERIDCEVCQIYAQAGVRFEQRWFGPFNQVRLHGPIGVAEMALRLGVSHAAASQTCSALVEAGLVAVAADPSDARRRPYVLTKAGLSLTLAMQPTWERLEAVSQELEVETGGLLAALEQLELALDRQSLKQRFEAS